MKARITNTVDIVDIPSEIQTLLKKIDGLLCKLCESNSTSYHVLNLDMNKSSNVQCAVGSMNNTKVLLADIQQELGEVIELTQGYANYVKQQEEQESKKHLLDKALKDKERQAAVPPPVPVETPSVPDNPITKELLDKIAELSDDVDEG